MKSPPTGTVTFLFTDIEGSTKLAQDQSVGFPTLLARHHEILNQSIELYNGYVFRVVGDAFSAAFHTASDAINSALTAQRIFFSENSETSFQLHIRMGIHTGNADWMGTDHEPQYEGYLTLATTNRIMSAGHGAQILVSQNIYDLVKDILPEVTFKNMGEHYLKDILHPQTIYQLNVSGLPINFPPLKTLKTIQHNLPLMLTSFIGREHELNQAKEKLASTRLLTLIGPGGTGKTRFSIQIGIEQLSNFKNGVWLIELAPISDATFIISTIASVFNLREVQGIPLINTVIDYLRVKEILLIFDNCEHLVEASAQLVNQLLHECSNLKIIASSREALGVDGETVFRVPSLTEDESTRLFIERATRAEPSFRLTKDNASFITQICSHLDGIPLAIELAAVRVKVFTPQQIAERLNDRFKLLTGGNRSALPRQQTLSALIDWSYQLLNESEQRAFCRLAVFSGGWTFEAAESVISESNAVDNLSGLVNKSLANVEEQNGASRYHFLETIRQYAMDKLLESGEASSTRDHHLDYFLKFAEPGEEGIFGKDRKHWLNVFELEHENLRSALRWGLDHDLLKAVKLIGILGNFWIARGYLAEGTKWFKGALDGIESLSRHDRDIVQIRARLFQGLAMLFNNRGEHRAAQEAAEKAIALSREAGNSNRLARALIVYGEASAFAGDWDQALHSLHESEKLCREMDYKAELSWVLGSLSYVISEIHGRAAAAEIDSYLVESHALDQQIDASQRSFRSKVFLAEQAYFRGNMEEARKYAYEVLSYHQEIGNTLAYNNYKSAIAHATRQIGNFEEALTIYRETILTYKDMGHRGAIAHQLECFAFIAKAQEQGERSVTLLSAAEALREISGSIMTPQEHIEYNQQIAELKAGMDEEIFNSLWAKGKLITMEQAIELALMEQL